MNRKTKPLYVLMVEDSPMDAELVKISLKKVGIECDMTVIDDIESLVDQLQHNDHDIVLSDCMIPGVSVEQVLSIVRKHDEDLPFIAVSGEINEEDAVSLLKSGAQDFVNKNNLSRLAPAIERELHEAAIRRGKRAAEISLSRSEERFQLAMQGTNDGLWDWDLVNDSMYYSPKWLEMLGLKASDVKATADTAREHLHPDDLERIDNEVDQFIKSNETRYETEFRLRHSSGYYINILFRALAVRRNGIAERIVGTSVNISDMKRKEEELKESRQQLRALASHLLNVREEEKANIAREIHDELGASLTALNMDIRWLDKKIPESEQKAKEKIDSMGELVSRSVDQCGRIVSELRPTLIDDLGLMAAIDWQANEFSKRYDIPCQISSNVEDLKLNEKQSIAAFRIMQEALTNIARHAEAKSVEVIVLTKKDRFYLQIADDGAGMLTNKDSGNNDWMWNKANSASVKESFGIRGMRERALSIGGTLNLESEPGLGTRVILSVPLNN